MFYLHAHVRQNENCFWAYRSRILGRDFVILEADPLAAEAFKPDEVETIRQFILQTYTGCECFPIECNSQKIIPENMRKLLNIA